MKLHHILFATLFCFCVSAQAQEKTFARNKVLLEKYTGINCGWCPSGDRAVEGYLCRHPEHRNVMVEMRHNSYSSPDRLTVPMHTAIDAVWKPNGYPKYYMDRCSTHDYPSRNVQDYAIDWGQFNDTDFDPVTTRINTPTHVSLDLKGSAYDPNTRELTIYAHGEVTKELPNLCINVFIVQDVDGYENTSRASMTVDLNGDDLRIFDGQYKVMYTTTLENKYGNCPVVAENMKVIAFVSSRFDTDKEGNRDFTNSEVHNADIVSITALPTKADIPNRCAVPEVNIMDGKVVFDCDTPGATLAYTIEPVEMTTTVATVSPTGEESPAFIIKASAGTPDLFFSETATKQFTLKDILLNKSVVDGLEQVSTVADDAVIFNLAGQRITAGTSALRPGVYVVNGKKIACGTK